MVLPEINDRPSPLEQQKKHLEEKIDEARTRLEIASALRVLRSTTQWAQFASLCNTMMEKREPALRKLDPMTEATTMARVQGELSVLSLLVACAEDSDREIAKAKQSIETLERSLDAVLESLRR